MDKFNQEFFDELSKFDYSAWSDPTINPWEASRLVTVQKMRKAGRISEDFQSVTERFVQTLARRSKEQYVFEPDFRVRPEQAYSFSKDRSGRCQLHVRFDAMRPTRYMSSGWGVSIGLGFEFHNDHELQYIGIEKHRSHSFDMKISQKCIQDYAFFVRDILLDDPNSIDDMFYRFDGYAEPYEQFNGRPISVDEIINSPPSILQPWFFFGRRLTIDEISSLGSMNNFVDECIRIFDVIKIYANMPLYFDE